MTLNFEKKAKITRKVAQIIWKEGISIGDFFDALEGQEDVLYGIIEGWQHTPDAED